DLAARMLHLMNVHNIDVLTALYQYKSPPYSPVLFRWNEKDNLEMIGDWDSSVSTFDIGSAGAGALLVRRQVFEVVQNPFDVMPPYSEDHSFFKRLKEAGIKSYCCPLIEAPHLVVKPLTLNDYAKEDVVLSERYEVGG